MIDDPNYIRDEFNHDIRRAAKLAAVDVIRKNGPMPLSSLSKLVGVPSKTMAQAILESWATFNTAEGRLANSRLVSLHRHLEHA